jgi:hypothetical protein
MTTDEQTMTDIRINKLQRTGRHSSRPDEVLFFSTAHFLFFNFLATTQLAHFVLPQSHKPAQRQNKKNHFSQRLITFS